jgi:hypothetical protein
MLSKIVVGSRDEARRFTCERPYAVISFVSHGSGRSAPRLTKSPLRRRRIVIRANDVYSEAHTEHHALTPAQAARITRFVIRIASAIDVLFIQCRHGEGRAVGAAIAIARAFGLPWRGFLTDDPQAVGNGHVTTLLTRAFEDLGYECGDGDPAAYDAEYTRKREEGRLRF